MVGESMAGGVGGPDRAKVREIALGDVSVAVTDDRSSAGVVSRIPGTTALEVPTGGRLTVGPVGDVPICVTVTPLPSSRSSITPARGCGAELSGGPPGDAGDLSVVPGERLCRAVDWSPLWAQWTALPSVSFHPPDFSHRLNAGFMYWPVNLPKYRGISISIWTNSSATRKMGRGVANLPPMSVSLCRAVCLSLAPAVNVDLPRDLFSPLLAVSLAGARPAFALVSATMKACGLTTGGHR